MQTSNEAAGAGGNFQDVIKFLDLEKVKLSIQNRKDAGFNDKEMVLTWQNINVYQPKSKTCMERVRRNSLSITRKKQIISNGKFELSKRAGS